MNGVKRDCTLVVPGLLDRPTVEQDTIGCLPALEQLLARAHCQSFERVGLEAVLFALFGQVVDPGHDLPVAAVSYLADMGRSAPGGCLRADPVHLVLDRDQLVLRGPETLSLSQVEADRLAGELNTVFAEDDWHIEALTPGRWYLHLPEVPRLRTYDLQQLRGRSIGDRLPDGPQGKYWRRIMNEIQMVLHTSEVNRERQAAGQLPVSSLWFWGGGKMPTTHGHSRWSELWSIEPVSLGLAQLAGTPRQTMPDNAQAWLRQATAGGEHLLLFPALREAEESEAWQEAVQHLQQVWIVPLLEALRRHQLTDLTLHPCNGHVFQISPGGLWRWWRRRRPLSFY
jgi:hypothetical protein